MTTTENAREHTHRLDERLTSTGLCSAFFGEERELTILERDETGDTIDLYVKQAGGDTIYVAVLRRRHVKPGQPDCYDMNIAEDEALGDDVGNVFHRREIDGIDAELEQIFLRIWPDA